MTPDRKRTVIEYGIPLDLVIIATGVAFLLPQRPALHLALYLAAVVGGAWYGGWKGGTAGTAFSLVALLFAGDLPLAYFAGFTAAGASIAAVVPRLRRREATGALSRHEERRLARELTKARQAAERNAAAALEREKARIERELRARVDAERTRLAKETEEQLQGALEAERADMRKQIAARLAKERARLEREAAEELARETRAAEEALQRQLEAEREELRRRVEEELSARRAALRTEVEAEPAPLVLARPLQLALPFLIVLIYWNASDILSRIFGIPSLLQPLVVLLGVIVWRNRELFVPSRIAVQPLTLLLGSYCLVIFLSTVWADNLALADERMIEITKNLLVYILVAALAWSWQALHRALATLVAAATGISAISLVQISTGNVLGQLGGFARVKEGQIYGDTFGIRAAGPVGDPNFYGQILVMVVPIAVFLAYSAQRRIARLAWTAAAATIVGAMLFTYSRGAMLALALMTAITMMVLRMPVLRIAIGTAAVFGLLMLLPGDVSRRFMTLVPQESGDDRDGSIEKRKLLAATALKMFDEHPVTGVGAGNFTTHFDAFANKVGAQARLNNKPGEFEHAHSLYLEIGAESGLLGLTTFLAAVGAAFLATRRSARQLALNSGRYALLPLGLAVALTGYMLTSLFLHTGYQRYAWLVLALIAATSRLAAEERPAREALA